MELAGMGRMRERGRARIGSHLMIKKNNWLPSHVSFRRVSIFFLEALVSSLFSTNQTASPPHSLFAATFFFCRGLLSGAIIVMSHIISP